MEGGGGGGGGENHPGAKGQANPVLRVKFHRHHDRAVTTPWLLSPKPPSSGAESGRLASYVSRIVSLLAIPAPAW